MKLFNRVFCNDNDNDDIVIVIMIIPGEADQMRRDIDEIRERREAEHQVVDGRISFQHFKEIIIGSFP